VQNYVSFIWIGLAVVFIIGFVGFTIGEILLLRKKVWIDEKLVWKYSVITNAASLFAAAFSFVFSLWILFIVAMVGVGYVEFTYRKDHPNLVDAVAVVFYVFAVVFPFFVYLIAFFLVRLLTTNIMVKSSDLTWKYLLGQSASLAALLLIVSCLFTMTFYL
jgi:hypothetical protein